MRYETEEGCHDTNCKYLHVCAVPTPEGRPCAGKHPACRHKSTPHWGGRRDSSRRIAEVPGSASLQSQTGSLPGTLFSAAVSATLRPGLASSQSPFSAAQLAWDAGSLDFDTCLQLLVDVLQPSTSTYFNFGACPRLQEVACTLYPCSPAQEDLVRFLNALLLRFFPDKTWACLWVNFDCKKLPHRDSQNAPGSENLTFSEGEVFGCTPMPVSPRTLS